MHWWGDVVYTSEIGFIFDLPYFITFPAAKRNTNHLRRWLFRSRITLNSLAYVTHVDLDWAIAPYAMLLTSLLLHGLSYVHALHQRRATAHHDDGALSSNGMLFLIAHVSAANFLFELPGRGIKAVRLTRALQLVFTLTAGLVFAFTLFTLTPLEDAWGCYAPEHAADLGAYSHGTCDVVDAPACRFVPVVRCGVAHGAIFNAEVHYATQGLIVAFVLYASGWKAKWDASHNP